jgi:hypothetical protein
MLLGVVIVKSLLLPGDKFLRNSREKLMLLNLTVKNLNLLKLVLLLEFQGFQHLNSEYSAFLVSIAPQIANHLL